MTLRVVTGLPSKVVAILCRMAGSMLTKLMLRLSDHLKKAAMHDQFKTGHTLEAVHDIGCSILPPAAEARLFLCANCVGHISERGHDAAGDRAWRSPLRCRPVVSPSHPPVGSK
jgi:hypothetical protein